MKKKLNKAEKFLGEIGIREFRTALGPSITNALDMYINYIWSRLGNENKIDILKIFEEALSSDIPEGYRRCTCDGILLDSFETKLAYKIKDYNQYNQYAQTINHFIFFHLLLRTEQNLGSSWLPYDRKFFEFKFSKFS